MEHWAKMGRKRVISHRSLSNYKRFTPKKKSCQGCGMKGFLHLGRDVARNLANI